MFLIGTGVMTDGFTDMVDRAQAFYADLARNNSRDWFEPRKDTWKADIQAPATLLADIVADDLAQMTGRLHKPKVFRINRDVRFSKDKSPYKTSLAMLWTQIDAAADAPAFYFGIEPTNTFVGCGVSEFGKDGLIRFRELVDAEGDTLTTLMAEAGVALVDIGPPALKRVPKPYTMDHPHQALLRRKSFAVGGPLPPDWKGCGLHAAIIQRFEALDPLRRFLADTL